MTQSETPKLAELVRQAPFSAERWAVLIGEHCHGRIGHASPIIGRSALLDALTAFFSVVDRVESPFAQSWSIGDAHIIESEAIFLNREGARETTPCVIIARQKGGPLRDLRIVIDPTAIWNWPAP